MDNKSTVMRQRIDETQSDLNDKLEELEHQISGTFKTVKDSVNSVRDHLDLKLQVRRRPWTLVAGAAALGFLGGFRSHSCGNGHTIQNNGSAGVSLANAAAAEPNVSTKGADAAQSDTTAVPGRLANLGDKFHPEISALRGVVVGALFEVFREIITKQASNLMAQSVEDANHGSKGKVG